MYDHPYQTAQGRRIQCNTTMKNTKWGLEQKSFLPKSLKKKFRTLQKWS